MVKCISIKLLFLKILFFSQYLLIVYLLRDYISPQIVSFIVQEHRKVTNFHGTQPKEILYIPNHFALWKIPAFLNSSKSFMESSSLQKSAYAFFLRSATANLYKVQTPGRPWTLQQHEVSDVWPGGHASEVHQSSGHGSFSSWWLDCDAAPGWWRNAKNS